MAKQKIEIPADADDVMMAAINKANEEIQAAFDRVDAIKQQKAAERETKKQAAEAEAELNRGKLTEAEAELASLSDASTALEVKISAAKKQIADLKKALGIKATRIRKPKEPQAGSTDDTVIHQETTTVLGEPESKSDLTEL